MLDGTLSFGKRMAEPQDIEFFPVAVPHAKTLSRAQVTQFNELGYISPLDALTPTEAIANRCYFDDLLARVKAYDDGRNAYSIMGYQNHCKGIWDLAQHPRIWTTLRIFLGFRFCLLVDPLLLQACKRIQAVLGTRTKPYWPVRPTKTVTAWLAIETLITPIPPCASFPKATVSADWNGERPGDFVLHQEIPDAQHYGKPYDNVLKADRCPAR
ncbi:MAG: hypothetical protein CM1200mP9_10070 [Gammaproteobacteria bacterium]|nr:MAG: hypothetical protein CM1200mP9_10070 [Gammaproteobacteria bacterium]